MKKKRKNGYLKTFMKYQDKMYLPGYYLGGKIPPQLLAKTKAGGYFFLTVGIIFFIVTIIAISRSLSLYNLSGIAGVIFSVLSIIVGIKFIKLNKINN